MEFTIGKRRVELTTERVMEALKGLWPEHFKGRTKYYAELDSRKYPLKQVIVAVISLPKESFTTEQVVKILRALDFEVKDLNQDGMKCGSCAPWSSA
jgi:hypothetical protein